jgi:hypothetical protein
MFHNLTPSIYRSSSDRPRQAQTYNAANKQLEPIPKAIPQHELPIDYIVLRTFSVIDSKSDIKPHDEKYCFENATKDEDVRTIVEKE